MERLDVRSVIEPGYGQGGKKLANRVVGLTEKLQGLINEPASQVQRCLDYCIDNGMDPDVSTVGDVLAHANLKYGLEGSARHMQLIFDRVDGKVEDKVRLDGKLSITDLLGQISD